jgi:hypothetical protein
LRSKHSLMWFTFISICDDGRDIMSEKGLLKKKTSILNWERGGGRLLFIFKQPKLETPRKLYLLHRIQRCNILFIYNKIYIHFRFFFFPVCSFLLFIVLHNSIIQAAVVVSACINVFPPSKNVSLEKC